MPCLKPKESNITWEYKRLNPLFSSDLLCGTAAESHSWPLSIEHRCSLAYRAARAFLFPSLCCAGTWAPFQTCKVLPLRSIANSGRLWFILCHNICLCELSCTVESQYFCCFWGKLFLHLMGLKISNSEIVPKLPLKCAWKCLCNKTCFHCYFHPLLMKSPVKIRWKVIPGPFPGLQS